MAEWPLLIFPKPSVIGLESGTSSRDKFVSPAHGRQGARLAPVLRELKHAFESRLAEVQATSNGIDPSQAIVIETIGSVENFATAVRTLEGLEWLGEIEIDDIAPDDDFYSLNTKGDRTEKTLVGRLYLIFSNQTAMDQLLTLWGRYRSDPDIVWPRGLTSLRDVFDKLHAIRRWDIQDRLIDSGALEYWEEDLQHFPDEPVRTEVELWYRKSPELRNAAQAEVERSVASAGGRVLQACEIGAIAYHAVLIELPRASVEHIISHRATELVKCDSIMFFRPTGQFFVGKPGDEQSFQSVLTSVTPQYPSGLPVIAVFDGLPVENHVLLQDRLIIDDPDDLSPNYPVRDRNHGTSMCSLVVWGDLSEQNSPLARPIYVRPVMAPEPSPSSSNLEAMPSDRLTIDYLHRAIRRLFEGEAGEPAAAETVRIINLSIGDRSRPFLQMVSPLARLIDWISHKYNVLFVISAGNQHADIELGVNRSELAAMSEEERQELTFRALYRQARHRRILSPAEAINGVTVNAIHQDLSGETHTGNLFEVFNAPLPSPIASFGGGYRRAIKPDVCYPGGRLLYDHSISGHAITCNSSRRAPGQQTAVPGSLPGENDRTGFCRGTSNSAALVTRNLGIAYEVLEDILAEQLPDQPTDAFAPALLKALLIHSSQWGHAGERLAQILDGEMQTRGRRYAINRLLGYGVPDIQRVLECTGQRATLLGFGSLVADQGHSYKMPLPPGLGAKKTPRKLTVTLAWLTPVAPTNQRYRAARLWFDIKGNRLTGARQEADHHAVKRGTVQHEIFTGTNAIAITQGDTLEIKVGCKVDAQAFEAPVNYGLAVSLEVAAEVDIEIYNEIRTGLLQQIELTAKNPIR
ncbi:S8 family peptidase [Aeoliella sp. SH292]|uniref:S8 family peptidase n=1 Tax=Aeoliella sp. SH292 TaxID=3454464 RepID=UPI003F9C0385